MSSNCPYCGATLNFGLKFCVVCGRQTAATNKMGSAILRNNLRQADMTQRIDEDMATSQLRTERSALRFRKGFRTLGQTIFYGFVAGALFFCAVRFAIEAIAPSGERTLMPHLTFPLFNMAPKKAAPDVNETDATDTGAASQDKQPKAKKNKKHGRHNRAKHNPAN